MWCVVPAAPTNADFNSLNVIEVTATLPCSTARGDVRALGSVDSPLSAQLKVSATALVYASLETVYYDGFALSHKLRCEREWERKSFILFYFFFCKVDPKPPLFSHPCPNASGSCLSTAHNNSQYSQRAEVCMTVQKVTSLRSQLFFYSGLPSQP